jgi:hypothetical protein
MKDNDNKPESVIHIEPAQENGTYANAATFIHSADEFVFDFIFILPGDKRKVVARVVTTPTHAKQMSEALLGNISRFENTYGAIKPPAADPARKGLQ